MAPSNPVELRIEREMKEAEEAIYGKPKGEAEGTPPVEVAPIVPVEPEATVTPDIEPIVPAAEPAIVPEVLADGEEQPAAQKKVRTDWKKRFTNMKASSDATIRGLRIENTSLRENQNTLIARVGAMEKSIAAAAPKQDIFDGLFTEEEKTSVGDEAISTFKKATQAAVEAATAPLRAQLDSQQSAIAKNATDKVKQSRVALDTEFLAKLGEVVPDYAVIDKNPAFAQFMKTVDAASGLPKEHIFRNAQSNFDVQRVADFFKQFKIATTPPQNPLEQKITPTSAAGDADNQPKPDAGLLTPQQILKFYDDVAGGHYDKKVKLRDEIEQRIDAQIRKAQQR